MNMMINFNIFLMLFIISAAHLPAQTITNMVVSQRSDGSGITDIYFTLAGTAPAYYIAVEASFNSGTTFTPAPSGSLSGDTGPITSGSGKHIIWNGLQNFPNTYSTQAKVKLNVTTALPSGSSCPGTPTVSYGGQTYNTVQIGSQCWFKENLNIGTMISGSSNQTNNGVIEKYCYNNDNSNCAVYGGLYQWNEMMQYVTTAGTQGICPSGWHIPIDAEWTTLTTYVNNQSSYLCNSTSGNISKAMAANTLWWSSGNSCAVGNNLSLNNATGFMAVPAGSSGGYGSFYNLGEKVRWWSSTESSYSNAWHREMWYNYTFVTRAFYLKDRGYPVRCLKDL